jgi:glycosyltransferase involved in cell wall biosynthesis
MLPKRKYALIHAHWILPHGFFAVIMKKIFGIRVIVSAHAGDIFPLRNPLLRIFARWTLNNCNAITVNSTATKNAVFAIADVPIKVIPMGVDLKLFSSSSAASAASVKKKYGVKGSMLLFVGRLAEKKGLTYLVSAMASVVKTYPDCKLVIVGDGPEKSALVRQSRQFGLLKNIVFAGSVPNSKLPSFYKAADVFVLPSIIARSGDTEGLGVVLLEAIASETPVVASNVGGIPDIVIDRKTGLLVRQKSPEELSSAILSLLKNKKLQKKLSASARSHVSKNYSWKKISSDFSSIYSSLLSKQK